MPGMGSGLTINNPLIVSAFRSALHAQALLVLAFLAVVAVAWSVLRSMRLRQALSGAPTSAVLAPEAPARRLLRVGFGLIWILDGILQAQISMPSA